MTARQLVVALVLAALAASTPSVAQLAGGGFSRIGAVRSVNWLVSVRGNDGFTAESPFEVSDGETPVSLRFVIDTASLRARNGFYDLSMGSSNPVRVSSANVDRFIVADDTIEVPFRTSGRVFVKGAPSAGPVRLTAIISEKKPVGVEYRFDMEGPRYFDSDFPTDERRKRLARAVVQLTFYTVHKGKGSCTAFQFAPGFFLTNLHCVRNSERLEDGKKGNRLIFGATVERPEGEDAVTATLAAPLNRSTFSGLDFAVLKADRPVPKSYADAILPLAQLQQVTNLQDTRELELYQQWTFAEANGKIGKALSDSATCRALIPSSSDQLPLCGAKAFIHRCNSEIGSSGSPVLLRNGSHVVGLHYEGRSPTIGNCAIRAEAIIGELRSNEELWAEIARTLER